MTGEDQADEKPRPPSKKEAQILIVDSNSAMSRLLSSMITRANLTYAIAQSGEEAVSYCKDCRYELILMEVNMPGMDGLEATKQIREISDQYKNIPIVAIAARMTEENIETYKAGGLNAQLKKPVNEVNLMRLLQQQLDVPIEVAHNRPPDEDEIYAVLDEDEMSLINWDTLHEYSLVLKKEYNNMMMDFLRVSPDLIGDMGEAIIDNNGGQVRALAHQLKSTSLIFGAEDVSNIAAQLEILGQADDLEHATQYYKELHMSFERIQPVLRKKLTLLKGEGKKEGEAAPQTH